jgi:hypothetical protein
MIWTERHSSFGDFELLIEPSLADAALFTPGTRMMIDQSDRVATVETALIETQDDGVKMFTVKGFTLEDMMNRRLNQSGFVLTPFKMAELTFTDTPGNIIRSLFHAICRTNANIPADNIEFIQAGTISSFTGQIAEPADVITIKVGPQSLYDTIKGICDLYNLGFRIIRPAEDSKLYFEVYTGFDRTAGQTARAPIVFSPNLDSLTDTAELTSITPYRNVAYVYNANGSQIVIADGVDPAIAGFDRRVMFVDASDITTTAQPALNNALIQRGKVELAQNRPAIAFDGKIPQNLSYKYGTSYKLGDLVEQRSDKGTSTIMRVTEQIFVHDASGEKSYPTLSLDTLVPAGSWMSLGTKTWNDLNPLLWNQL